MAHDMRLALRTIPSRDRNKVIVGFEMTYDPALDDVTGVEIITDANVQEMSQREALDYIRGFIEAIESTLDQATEAMDDGAARVYDSREEELRGEGKSSLFPKDGGR